MSFAKLVRTFFLLNFLAISTLAISAWAAEEDHTWTLGGELGGPGEQADIFIAVENEVELSAATIEVHYDTSVVEYVDPSVEALGRATDAGFNPNTLAYDTFVRIVYFSLSGKIAAGSGDIGKIAFKVKDGVAAGTVTTIELTRKNADPVLTTQEYTVQEAAGLAFQQMGTQVVNLGDVLEFHVSLTDTTLEGVAYEMVSAPAPEAVFDAATRTLTWTPTASGEFDAVFAAAKDDLTDTLTVDISVNNLPVLTDPGPQAFNVGEDFNLTLEVTDADGNDIHRFHMETAPGDGATLDSITGEFYWTSSMAGDYTAVFSVTDSYGGDTLDVDIKVNNPPVLTDPGSQQAATGQLFTLQLEASDDDGDELVYRLTTSPGAGAAIDSATGEFTWMPVEVGTFTAVFEVTDRVASVTVSVEFTVEQGAMPVVIDSPEEGDQFNTNEGQQIQITFEVTNPGDSLFREELDQPAAAEWTSITVFTWTPGPADAGTYPVTVVYSNETGGVDTVSVSIVVSAVNSPPTWGEITVEFSLNENQEFTHTFAQPTDLDPGDILTATATNLPSGAQFDDATLSVTWTPGYDDQGIHEFTLTVADQAGGSESWIITLEVLNVNRPPEITASVESVEVDEGQQVSFTVTATDPDNEPVGVAVEGLPEGAAFLAPAFTWPQAVVGVYTVTFIASDIGGLEDTVEVEITVNAVNHPPVFEAVADKLVDEGVEVRFDLQATDPDGDELTYSLVVTADGNILDRGAVFSVQTFTWTPAAADVGPNIVTFKVEDPSGGSDQIEVKIVVAGRNLDAPPEFDAPFDVQRIDEGLELVYELPLVDTSVELRQRVIFWAVNLPPGAQFDNINGVLTWTPTLLQSGSYEIEFGVSDGKFQDIENLVVDVLETDVLPELSPIGDLTVRENELLRVLLQATDASGEGVEFDASGLPVGADVFPQGLLSFKPNFDQAGTYSITFTARDASGNAVDETVTLTVVDVNRRPGLDVHNYKIVEGQLLNFTVGATDPDGDPLVYGVVESTMPSGATFNVSSHTFNWMPGQGQSGNYSVQFTVTDNKPENSTDSATVVITVGNVNQPPEIDLIANQTVAEGATLPLSISAGDPDIGNTVTIQVSGLPAGAQVAPSGANPVIAAVTVTPGYQQAGVYQVTVTATDNDPADPLSVERRFTLEVTDTDVAPAFTGDLAVTGILELSVNEGETLELALEAQDPGGDELTFSASGLPKNASLDNSTDPPQVVFTPGYDQGSDQGQVYQFIVVVSDGNYSVDKTVSVTVSNTNRPPIVFQLDDQTVPVGYVIAFEVNASDPDGDGFQIHTAGRVPQLTLGDDPPARLRDGNVFVFDTELLPADLQIESALFVFWAVDDPGAVSDTVKVEIAVTRSDSAEIANLIAGNDFVISPQGYGMVIVVGNGSTAMIYGSANFSETSGFIDSGYVPTLLAGAGEDAPKRRKGVYTFLAGADESQFYGIRRGWGVDLTSLQAEGQTELPEGVNTTVTLTYMDEDLPTEVPNFTEARLNVFGFDESIGEKGEWVLITDATVDTVANEAVFTVSNYSITKYTLGAILDVIAPMITDLKVCSETITVRATGVDTLYDLSGNYEFKVNITDDQVVSPTNAKLYYKLTTLSGYAELELARTGVNLFTAPLELESVESGTSFHYYVVAQDSMNVVTLPQDAPNNVFEVVFMEYTLQPGDVDGSGAVDIFDLLDLLKVLGGSKEASMASDVDSNGKTDIFDLLELLKLLAG